MLPTMRGIIVAAVLLLGGCGDDGGAPSADGGGTPSVDAGADPQVQTFTCSAGAVTFPPLDKSCTTASDCILVIHQTDCCGNAAAVAIGASGGEAFWAAEAQCAAMFPACGCAMGPLSTEDGLMVATGAQLVDGVCVDNRCLSKATGTGAR
jgi:hypothetical protein